MEERERKVEERRGGGKGGEGGGEVGVQELPRRGLL